MIAALMEAGRFCEVPENRIELARMLSQRKYFDVSQTLLANGLAGPFDSGRGRRLVKDFVIYDVLKTGAPTRAKGQWVFDLVRTLGNHERNRALRSDVIPKVFREDIFRKAAKLCPPSVGSPGPPAAERAPRVASEASATRPEAPRACAAVPATAATHGPARARA